MSCHQVSLFPKIVCLPDYSCARLRVEVPARMDTTQLREYYRFSGLDLELKWEAEVDKTTGAGELECKNVGSDVRKPGAQVINYTPTVLAWSKAHGYERKWILLPLPCQDSGSAPDEDGPYKAVSLPGVVSYANPPIRAAHLPTFVPRGYTNINRPDEPEELPEEPTTSGCFWLGRYLGNGKVQVYLLGGEGDSTELVPDAVIDCVPIL